MHQGKIEKEERQIEELQEDLEMVEATMCRRFSGVCVILQAGNCEPGRAIPHVVLYGEGGGMGGWRVSCAARNPALRMA